MYSFPFTNKQTSDYSEKVENLIKAEIIMISIIWNNKINVKLNHKIMPTGKGIVRDADDEGMGNGPPTVGYLQVLEYNGGFTHPLVGKPKIFRRIGPGAIVSVGDIVDFELPGARENPGNSISMFVARIT